MNDTQITLAGWIGGDVTLRELPTDEPSRPSGWRAPRRDTATASG